MTKYIPDSLRAAALGASALVAFTGMASADQVILDDLIVDGSACIGQDCVNGESFGFDTIRIKENNLRIKAQDTSSTASFPSNDWQITFNDSANGGQNKFSIDDIDNGRTPFTITAAARSNSIFVNSNGNVGFGTATPAVTLHARSGNTPTLRLEQDGSSGFTAQTWDVAANETNFFIRDATNGSKLPLRIRPDAPSNSVFVQNNGDIGMGTASPSAPLHVNRTSTTKSTVLVEAATGDAALELKQDGATAAHWEIRNQAGSGRLNFGIVGGNTPLKIDETAANNLLQLGTNSNASLVDIEGSLQVSGSITVASQTLNVPDYVFEDGYALMPLSEVAGFIDTNGHLPGVPSAAEITSTGTMDLVGMQLTLLEKIEELTLHTIAQERMMQSQQDTIAALTARIDTLQTAD